MIPLLSRLTISKPIRKRVAKPKSMAAFNRLARLRRDAVALSAIPRSLNSAKYRITNPRPAIWRALMLRGMFYKKPHSFLRGKIKMAFLPKQKKYDRLTTIEEVKSRIDKFSICRIRKNRKDFIMRKTKGRGMRVKRARWNIKSLVRC